MIIGQGEIWWVDLGEPMGTAVGLRRPVVIVQGDAFNRSRIATVACVPLTSRLQWSKAPSNVLLPSSATGLPRDAVANAPHIVTLDRDALTHRVGKLSPEKLRLVLAGIDIVLGR